MNHIDYIHLAKTDLNLLLAFDAIYRERSVTRAAALVGVTQSAMSHNLGRLRAMFNDDLFVRVPKGMEPTPRAVTLQTRVSDMLRELQQLITQTQDFDAASVQKQFHLGVPDYVEGLLVPRLLKEIFSKAPGICISLYSTEQSRMLSELDNGTLDLCLIKDQSGGELNKRRLLWSENYVCLFDRAALGGQDDISWEQYVTADHLMVTSHEKSCWAIDHHLAKMSQQRRALLTTPHLHTLPKLLSGTRLIASVPRSFGLDTAAQTGLAVCPLPFRIPDFNISMIWHASLDKDPANSWLRNAVIAALEGLQLVVAVDGEVAAPAESSALHL